MDDRASFHLPVQQQVTTLPGTVVVIDQFLPDHQRAMVLDFLRGGGWRWGWKSASKTDLFAFWHRHFAGHRNGRASTPYDCANELRQTAPMLHALWRHLEAEVFPGHTLTRCYANAQAYGTDGTLHTDSKRTNSFTSVYYPHARWEPNWAGETVVFNADKSDIIGSIYPKPNRLVVFRGDAPHLARGVSRTCPELRITLMYKTVLGSIEGEHGDD